FGRGVAGEDEVAGDEFLGLGGGAVAEERDGAARADRGRGGGGLEAPGAHELAVGGEREAELVVVVDVAEDVLAGAGRLVLAVDDQLDDPAVRLADGTAPERPGARRADLDGAGFVDGK